ncbi:glycosyltransferase family 4 protein [Flavobacteriaceae bacterium GSB9]|nr:glycosyltransferase family 4 protein [Flavobacteriaceae bacterium GSB9]
MKRDRLLLIGPLPEPTTGVSLANKTVVEGLNKDKSVGIDFINTSYSKFEEKLGGFSISKALYFLKLNLFAYKIFKANIVYITPGQTFLGVVKYGLFISLSWVLGKELIVHVHGNYLGKEFQQLKGVKKRVFKWLLSKTTKGIVLSESLADNMSPFIEDEKIYVLYNFVEDYLFSEKKCDNKDLTNKPKIVFLSNLMKEKGIIDFLEALKILEAEGFEYEAKIAGNIDAQNKQEINQYFKTLKNIEYCGVVSGKEKKDLLNWGNAFILPTYYEMEGQPISILEAMATRNIILTTKHAGIPDVFEEGINGFYIEKRNPMSIVSTIKEIATMSNSNEIMENNYLIASKFYRVENFIGKLLKILRS